MQRVIEKLNLHNHKKAVYGLSAFVALVIVFCTVYSLILPAVTLTTQPTGVETNCTLSYNMYNDPKKSYRAYLEYSLQNTTKKETFGIMRKSIIYVYAYAGETICLGSDIVYSRIDNNDNVLTIESGADITLIAPDGTKYGFDNNEETGLGYIGTAEQEKNGANYKGSGNTEGYIPHEFYVRQTGIYEVRFHSFDAGDFSTKLTSGVDEPHLRPSTNKNLTDTKTSGGTGDPAPNKLQDDEWANTGATVGAFDATVICDGKVKTGRAFADYLALNMGGNMSAPSFYADFYMVTSDGYIYRSKYNLDPFGFIFFANSRGVVDTETGYSAYHSIRAKGQVSGSKEMNLSGMNYTVFTPQNEGTIFDSTYRIFFEMPDEALQGTLFQRAFAPERIEDIEFLGSKEGNVTYVGNGGYLRFNVENATSVSIEISFDDYNADHDTTYANTVINANVIPGINYVYWDGNDQEGNIIPEGWYKEGKINIKVYTHAGEIHFPFLDVENGDGVSFERVNKIYDYVDGVLTDVTENYEASKYTIYYDNTTYLRKRNNPNYVEDDEKTYIADNLSQKRGVSSESLQMYWRNSRGDCTILDVWTYALAEQNTTIYTDIIIEDLDGYYTVDLSGLAFFDKDKSARYDISEGDFTLDNVDVSLDYFYCETRWGNVERNGDGIVTRLCPTAHTSTETDEMGNENKSIDYYYHNYEVRYEADGKYHLYKYASNDPDHLGNTSPALDKDGNEIILGVDIAERYIDEAEDYAYLVWIPVHRETTTNAVGEYHFPGVLLVNEALYSIPTDEVNNITISVKNPDKVFYELTTMDEVTGDFGTEGDDEDYGSQVIHLTELYDKVIEEKGDTEKIVFFHSLADVGYYYDAKEPPLTVAKRWGTAGDSENVESIVFGVEGYVETETEAVICYSKTVTVDFRKWVKTINALPAGYTINGERYEIQYRIGYEMYNKGGETFIYTYHWDEEEPYGSYEKVLTFDENGEPLTKELLDEYNYPYETYISPLEEQTVTDYIYVENWTKDTTGITITKYGANDNVTKLQNATFKLQKFNTETDEYEDVETLLGTYTVTTDASGVAIFRGLSEGRYKLVETVAPEHYEPAKSVYFTVSKDLNVDKGDKIEGNYDEGYTVNVYDELSEAPVSKIMKYDQYGSPVSGASFSAYKSDENYNYNHGDEPLFTVTTGTDGSAAIMTTRDDGTEREMYISELVSLLEGSRNFVLIETNIPDGYRDVGEAHIKIAGSGMDSYLICENPYDSGVWSKPAATVYAKDILQIVKSSDYNKIKGSNIDNDKGTIKFTHYLANGNIDTNGTLFAVVLKRGNAEPDVTDIRNFTTNDWEPVYGDDINGYHVVTGYGKTIDAVMEVVDKDYAVAFETNANNEVYANIVNFPGYSTDYYTYYFDNNLSPTPESPQFVVAYFYTTADSLEGATAKNTVQVRSHGFQGHGVGTFDIHWSTTINVADIVNSLYVQKRDTGGNLVDYATFGLYDAVADSNGKGYYVGKDKDGETVYIDLTEDNSLKATVYGGTVTNDVLTITETLKSNVKYTTKPEDYVTIDRLSDTDDLMLASGYLKSRSDKPVGVISLDGGNYTIKPTEDANESSCVIYTHGKCEAVEEYGTGHFKFLHKGKYFLREIGAPVGFELNNANVEVFVGNLEVYANAGPLNDGVRVGNGAGFLISTLNVFASIGDINETLSYLATALRIEDNPSSVDGFTDMSDVKTWQYIKFDESDPTRYIFTGNDNSLGTASATGEIQDAAVLYLRYNGNANGDDLIKLRRTLFDYTYCDDDAANNNRTVIKSLTLWTESGWSDLGIFQNLGYAQAQLLKAPNGSGIKFTNVSVKRDENGEIIYKPDGVTPVEKDISHLFSSSTFVSFEDVTSVNLKLKKVTATSNEPLNNARFVLFRVENNENYYYTADEDNNVSWVPLSGSESAYDYSVATDNLGEIYYSSLEPGEYYFEEIEPPDAYLPLGYKIRLTIKGNDVEAVKDSNGRPIAIDNAEYDDTIDDYVYTMTVTNTKGYILPATGGNALLIYAFGIILTIAGVMYIYTVNHKRKRGLKK